MSMYVRKITEPYVSVPVPVFNPVVASVAKQSSVVKCRWINYVSTNIFNYIG